MEEHQVGLKDSIALLDIAMLLAEELNVPHDTHDPADSLSLAVIWSRIQDWIKQGLYPPVHGRPHKPQLHLQSQTTTNPFSCLRGK